MFDGMQRRVVSMWFARLASDRVLRARPCDGPFALTLKRANADRLYCLNRAAEAQNLSRGMTFADARAFCPDLLSQPANLTEDRRFRPVVISETGADGDHTPHGPKRGLFSLAYQDEVYRKQIATLRELDYVKGMSPWILYDFRVERRQGVFQRGWNRKGSCGQRGHRHRRHSETEPQQPA